MGKVEATLKTHHLVENICVYGDPYKKYTVALVSFVRKNFFPRVFKKYSRYVFVYLFGLLNFFQVVPSKIHLESMGHQLGKVLNYQDLVIDPDVQANVLKVLSNHGSKRGLEKFEIPAAITLIAESWTPESGVITAAFKLKRKVIQNLYQRDIDRMYA